MATEPSPATEYRLEFLAGKIGIFSGLFFIMALVGNPVVYPMGKTAISGGDAIFFSCLGIFVILSFFIALEWSMYGKPCLILDPHMVSDLIGDSPRIIRSIIVGIILTFSLFIFTFFLMAFRTPVAHYNIFEVYIVWGSLALVTICLALFYYRLKQNRAAGSEG
jgi:hypothetical protein